MNETPMSICKKVTRFCLLAAVLSSGFTAFCIDNHYDHTITGIQIIILGAGPYGEANQITTASIETDDNQLVFEFDGLSIRVGDAYIELDRGFFGSLRGITLFFPGYSPFYVDLHKTDPASQFKQNMNHFLDLSPDAQFMSNCELAIQAAHEDDIGMPVTEATIIHAVLDALFYSMNAEQFTQADFDEVISVFDNMSDWYLEFPQSNGQFE